MFDHGAKNILCFRRFQQSRPLGFVATGQAIQFSVEMFVATDKGTDGAYKHSDEIGILACIGKRTDGPCPCKLNQAQARGLPPAQFRRAP